MGKIIPKNHLLSALLFSRVEAYEHSNRKSIGENKKTFGLWVLKFVKFLSEAQVLSLFSVSLPIFNIFLVDQIE